MGLPYRITRVDITDPAILKTLTNLHKVCLESDELPSFEAGEWWIAYQGKTPVAFAGMVPSQQWLDTGYMTRAGVVPQHRGHGLQKRLIRARIARARALGWTDVITYTWNNPPSANSLIACGFRAYDPSKPWASEAVSYWRRRV